MGAELQETHKERVSYKERVSITRNSRGMSELQETLEIIVVVL